eukprot:906691-Pyramimonas_sp.AAC.2
MLGPDLCNACGHQLPLRLRNQCNRTGTKSDWIRDETKSRLSEGSGLMLARKWATSRWRGAAPAPARHPGRPTACGARARGRGRTGGAQPPGPPAGARSEGGSWAHPGAAARSPRPEGGRHQVPSDVSLSNVIQSVRAGGQMRASQVTCK